MLHKCLVPDQEYLGPQTTGAPNHKTRRVCQSPPCGRGHSQHFRQGIDGPSWSTILQNDTATLSALDDGSTYNSGRYCEAPEESLRDEATDRIEELLQERALVRTLSLSVSLP